MLLNAWTGVRAVNPLWLRAGSAMGADERALFWKVIVPGALPVPHHRPAPGLPARLDRRGRRRDAGRLRLGPGLGHLRRQGVPQGRRDAGLARRHRPHRLPLRAPGVRDAWSARRCRGGAWCGPSKAEKRHAPHRGPRRLARLRHAGRARHGRGAARASTSSSPSSSASSAPAAAASPRCSTSSPASSRPPAARSASAARRSTGHGMDRGIVFQDFAQLFPWRTALGNVAFGLEMKGVPRPERERIALEQLRARQAREVRQRLSAPPLRRHAAAGRHRPGAGLQSERAADGRAVRGARCAHPRRHAAAAQRGVAGDAQDGGVRDAQCGRGRLSRRPRAGHDPAPRHREGARADPPPPPARPAQRGISGVSEGAAAPPRRRWVSERSP